MQILRWEKAKTGYWVEKKRKKEDNHNADIDMGKMKIGMRKRQNEDNDIADIEMAKRLKNDIGIKKRESKKKNNHVADIEIEKG